MTTFLSRMSETRSVAAGAHHPSLGFLVSGGCTATGSTRCNGTSARLTSSEVSFDGASWGAFTPLPIGLSSHCVVALDSNYGVFFLAGGWDGSNQLDRAFIHDNIYWVEVTPMPTARYGKKSN